MKKKKIVVTWKLKTMNEYYGRKYTLADVSEKAGVSREALSRLTTDSSFRVIYNVTEAIYELFPEYNLGIWDFGKYVNIWFMDMHDLGIELSCQIRERSGSDKQPKSIDFSCDIG